MRILFITAELPYPLASGHVRHYQFLRGLGKRHRITYLTLTRHAVVPQEALDLVAPFVDGTAVFGTPCEGEPWPIRLARPMPICGAKIQRALRARYAVKDMRRAVGDLLRREHVDVILFTGKETFEAIRDVRSVPIVADCCDATHVRIAGEMRRSGLLRALWLGARYAEVRGMQRELVRRTPYLLFASARDQAAVHATQGTIIPQGIDAENWTRSGAVAETPCIVFVGVMRYPPNHDAAMHLINHVFPSVRRAVPGVELYIVGRDPLRALIDTAAPHKDVIVTGSVPDVRVYLERASVFAAPIRFASGVQNKILEALSMEVPVLTTPVVAQGLEGHGTPPPIIVAAPESRSFADALTRLLQDSAARRELSIQGRHFVQEYFAWSTILDNLESVCIAAAEHRQIDHEEHPCFLSR